MLIIDDPSSVLAGGAGWVGAGLLGVVLLWLLTVHLPQTRKELREYLAAKDLQLKEQAERAREAERLAFGDFKEALTFVSSTNKMQTELLILHLDRQIDALAKTIDTLAVAIDREKR